MTDDASRLSAGRVGKAHGLDGSFYVTRPRPGVFVLGLSVEVAGTLTSVTRLSGTADKPILSLAGVQGRSAVEPLRGEDLMVDRAALPPLADDEWFAEDLEGCAVTDGAVAVGSVRRLLGLPSCEVLEVARAEGGADLLVPMVGDAVRSIDVAAKTIDVDLEFLGEAGDASADAGEAEG